MNLIFLASKTGNLGLSKKYVCSRFAFGKAPSHPQNASPGQSSQ